MRLAREQQLAVRHHGGGGGGLTMHMGEKTGNDPDHVDHFELGVLQQSELESEFLLSKENDGGSSTTLKEKSSSASSGSWQQQQQRKLLLHMVSSFLVVAHLAANLNYLTFKVGLYWRDPGGAARAPWLLLVLACELAYFAAQLVGAVDYLIPPNARPELWFHGAGGGKQQQHGGGGGYYPMVHVLVATCREPTDVPKESVLAAMALHYPRDRFKVLVLDDGPDEELRAFCEAAAAESGGQQLLYLRREKRPGVPHNFKCGNLNFGLHHSAGAEYVLVMDADMILHPSFLRRTLPHIVDAPDVAFVQVPQAYYNLARGDPLNHASTLWYERVLVHRDSLGSATCVGTGALFRRTHLDAVGGFQPHSVAEDTLTAFALFNRGFKSVYLNQQLQVGVAPWTFRGTVLQRQRWGLGAIQQLAATWRAMLGPGGGLTAVQQLLYLWHTAYYYLSLANLALLLALLAALAFRLPLTLPGGDPADARRLVSYLALTLVLGRLAWTAVWLPLPGAALHARNRDESQFWWMTPFFVAMVAQSVFRWPSTFSFVPTSAVDRAASAARSSSLRPVRFHLAYAAAAAAVVSARLYQLLASSDPLDCKQAFFTLGLSVFLLATAAHMLVPVAHILATKRTPADRRALLRYGPDGVPRFTPGEYAPAPAHASALLFEAISVLTLLFWAAVLYAVNTGLDLDFCQDEQGLF